MKFYLLTSIKKLTVIRFVAIAVTLLAISSASFVYASNAPANSPQAQSAAKPALTEEVLKGKPYVITKMLVSAPIEQVWKVLADLKNATHVFPVLKKCDVLEDHGTTKVARQVIAPSGMPGTTYDYVLTIQQTAPSFIEWHRLSGDFKAVEGFWKLESTDSGHSTMVTYGSYIDGGFFLPQALIKHQARKDLPSTLLALKNQAELNNQIASRAAAIQ